MATVLQTAPALQLRRSPIINEGNIRQHLLRFTLQVWQKNDLNLLSLRLIPFIKHGFVLLLGASNSKLDFSTFVLESRVSLSFRIAIK